MYILSTRHNGESVESQHATYNQAMIVLIDHVEYWQTHHRGYVNAKIVRVDSEIQHTPICSYNSVDGWLEPS